MFFRNLLLKFLILLSNESNIPEISLYDHNIFLFLKEVLVYQKFLIYIEKLFFYRDSISLIAKTSEISRFENLIKLYHVNRIWKIETKLFFLNKKFIKYCRFNTEEQKYVHKYTILCQKFIKIQFLDFIPSKAKDITKQGYKFYKNKMALKKIMCIFFKIIKKNINKRITSIYSLGKFYKNKTYCTKYKKIKHFFHSSVCFSF